MTLYTVWSGEYSDRTMNAVFKSKEKAEKYVEIHNQLDNYDDHYIIEYEFSDDKIDMDSTVTEYYSASVCCNDRWNYDNTVLLEKEGTITTDWMWSEFMEEFEIDDFDKLNPNKELADHLLLEFGKVLEDVVEEYSLTDKHIDHGETFVDYERFKRGNDEEETLWNITVYSKLGYGHARKIALDKYYQYKAEKEGLC